ncbi:MAG: type II secretion system protein GspJ [bacterium]
MKTRGPQSGFTLLEVMIALAILAAMALAMFVATQQTLNSKQSTEDRDDANHAIVQALNRMAADLDMAVIVKGKELLGADFDGEYAMEGSEERLDFVAFSHQRFISGAKESDLAEISYFLVPMPDEPDKHILMRRESTKIDKNLQEGGVAFPLLENVETLRFEYLDPKSGEFKKTWDSKSIDFNNQLPQAVKITIEAVLPDEEQKSSFATIAPIQLTRPLSF